MWLDAYIVETVVENPVGGYMYTSCRICIPIYRVRVGDDAAGYGLTAAGSGERRAVEK